MPAVPIHRIPCSMGRIMNTQWRKVPGEFKSHVYARARTSITWSDHARDVSLAQRRGGFIIIDFDVIYDLTHKTSTDVNKRTSPLNIWCSGVACLFSVQ